MDVGQPGQSHCRGSGSKSDPLSDPHLTILGNLDVDYVGAAADRTVFDVRLIRAG